MSEGIAELRDRIAALEMSVKEERKDAFRIACSRLRSIMAEHEGDTLPADYLYKRIQGLVDRLGEDDLPEPLTARVAELEQYISDLERSLESVRKERDEALARLDAKAQGYEAAVADSVALIKYVSEQAAVACEEETRTVPSCGDCATCRARQLTSTPHPSAALLERMKRLEGGLEALRSVRTYARELTDRPDPLDTSILDIGRGLLERLATHGAIDLIDGH